jgi:hypothetical protein
MAYRQYFIKRGTDFASEFMFLKHKILLILIPFSKDEIGFANSLSNPVGFETRLASLTHFPTRRVGKRDCHARLWRARNDKKVLHPSQ